MAAVSPDSRALAPTADAMRPPAPDAIEVLLTLAPDVYRRMGGDLQELRRKLDLPRSASNTEIILEAVHRQARGHINSASDDRGQGAVADQGRVSGGAARLASDDRATAASVPSGRRSESLHAERGRSSAQGQGSQKAVLTPRVRASGEAAAIEAGVHGFARGLELHLRAERPDDRAKLARLESGDDADEVSPMMGEN